MGEGLDSDKFRRGLHSYADAMADAMAGQEAAVSTGYVPAPFVLI